MDLVKGGSLTYSNRHKLRMEQTDPSEIPNDLILRIIREANGGRYGYTGRPQFDACMVELTKLSKYTKKDVDIWNNEFDTDPNILFHRDQLGWEEPGWFYQWFDHNAFWQPPSDAQIKSRCPPEDFWGFGFCMIDALKEKNGLIEGVLFGMFGDREN